ncbi:hypothetical protein [Rhizobium sp. LC145]|uniref:hypothetical protein n=1 Tax=Rhizobium sp. LC145 TaxID=1120688 RepID=UPI00062A4421|nr:hypothetical protein [Rhizobium sp. LC145]KKX33953.1 hypothetical protein YH62_01905 [Rhizobium sp. LC145]TKT42575.1 hypothetical protein FDR95_28730 [Rhizobiaceae bacterium LC148]
MEIKEEFQLLYRCPVCGDPCEAWTVNLPHPNLSADGENVEVSTVLEVECESCGQSSDVTVTAHLLHWSGHISGDPNTIVEITHHDYREDEWLEELEPEAHPYSNYTDAISEWRKLLNELGEASETSGRNRMLLVQLFSILEAYLSDAVVGLAHQKDAVLKSIIRWHPDLKSEQVSLVSVAENPNFVRELVVAKLRRTQFHRFEHVNGMLRAAIDLHFLPSDKSARDKAIEATKIRHACVHRNGRDQNGRIVGITRDYLKGLADLFNRRVNELDRHIAKMEEESRRDVFIDDLVDF